MENRVFLGAGFNCITEWEGCLKIIEIISVIHQFLFRPHVSHTHCKSVREARDVCLDSLCVILTQENQPFSVPELVGNKSLLGTHIAVLFRSTVDIFHISTFSDMKLFTGDTNAWSRLLVERCEKGLLFSTMIVKQTCGHLCQREKKLSRYLFVLIV